jgi:hypothetical protein
MKGQNKGSEKVQDAERPQRKLILTEKDCLRELYKKMQ